MKKRIALAAAALALPFTLAAPAQAATPAHHNGGGCVWSSGAWICQGVYPPPTVAKPAPSRISAAQVRAYNRQLLIARYQARLAALNLTR